MLVRETVAVKRYNQNDTNTNMSFTILKVIYSRDGEFRESTTGAYAGR